MFSLENEHLPCGKEGDTVTYDNCSHNFTCSNDCFLMQEFFLLYSPSHTRMGIADPDPNLTRRGRNPDLGQWSIKRVVSTQKETCQWYYFPKRRPSASARSPVMSQHLQDLIQLMWPGMQHLAPSSLLSSFYLPENPHALNWQFPNPTHTLSSSLLFILLPPLPSASPANFYSSFKIQVESFISEKLPWLSPQLLHPIDFCPYT